MTREEKQLALKWSNAVHCYSEIETRFGPRSVQERQAEQNLIAFERANNICQTKLTKFIDWFERNNWRRLR